MTEIYDKYQNDGFQLLAYPCNQFNNQEPGTNAEIKAYAHDTYGSTFPMFAKIDVNGENACPTYKFLRYHSSLFNSETGMAGEIPWNFAKFLLDGDGHVVNYYDP